MVYSKLYVRRNNRIVAVVNNLEKIDALSIFFSDDICFDIYYDNGLYAFTGAVPAGHTLIVGKSECGFEDIS